MVSDEHKKPSLMFIQNVWKRNNDIFHVWVFPFSSIPKYRFTYILLFLNQNTFNNHYKSSSNGDWCLNMRIQIWRMGSVASISGSTVKTYYVTSTFDRTESNTVWKNRDGKLWLGIQKNQILKMSIRNNYPIYFMYILPFIMLFQDIF